MPCTSRKRWCLHGRVGVAWLAVLRFGSRFSTASFKRQAGWFAADSFLGPWARPNPRGLRSRRARRARHACHWARAGGPRGAGRRRGAVPRLPLRLGLYQAPLPGLLRPAGAPRAARLPGHPVRGAPTCSAGTGTGDAGANLQPRPLLALSFPHLVEGLGRCSALLCTQQAGLNADCCLGADPPLLLLLLLLL